MAEATGLVKYTKQKTLLNLIIWNFEGLKKSMKDSELTEQLL